MPIFICRTYHSRFYKIIYYTLFFILPRRTGKNLSVVIMLYAILIKLQK